MHVRSHYASPQKISEVTIQSHVVFIGIISSGGVTFSQTPLRSEQIAFQTVAYASQRRVPHPDFQVHLTSLRRD